MLPTRDTEAPPLGEPFNTQQKELAKDIATLKNDLASLKADAEKKWKPHDEAGVGSKLEGVIAAAVTGAVSAALTGAAINLSPIKIEPKPYFKFEPEFKGSRDVTSRYDDWRARKSAGRFITESLQAERRLQDMDLRIKLHSNRLVRLEAHTSRADTALFGASNNTTRAVRQLTGELG
ncbi:hypothetical protein [Streptomyces sp. NPDC050504]|uniref:hypothetical protein n=1 Tax=Streptomyces sp. NPDC050504 TaxID=3365618 RepID=UPI0037BD89A2